MSSLLESAGFTLPDDPAPPQSVQAARPVAASSDGSSMLEAAGFSLPGKSQTVQTQSILPPAKPQGRGWPQAIHDYFLEELPKSILQTVEAPGALMTKNPYPEGSESWQFFENSKQAAIIPAAVGLAGLTEGTKIPKVGPAALAEKVAPSSQAVNKLVAAIGPENVPAAVERLQANPRLAVADVSDPVRTMTQGLVDPAQPKAQNVISDAVKNRLQGATQATNDAYTTAMGPSPDVVKMVEGLKERARAAGREAIQPALENAKLVDTSPVIEAIDAKLQPGVNPLLNPKSELPLSAEQEELARFKQQLVSGSGEQLFDAQRLHRVQSDIGDKAYQLSQSPDPKDRLLGGQLRGMNEKLIDQIDAATGGAYRPARQKFKDAKDISAAFESGFDTLKNRQGLTGALEDTPDALRAWIKEATPEEIRARQLGTRADIAQKINGVKNGALAGETITRIEYNKDKLRALFGDNEANRLIRNMEDARDQAVTNTKLIANSKTAETLAGQKALAVPKVGGGNPLAYVSPVAAEILGEGYGLPGVGLAATLALKGAHMGIQKLGHMNALARNTEFAKAAMATGSARQLLMNRLISHPKVIRALRQ